MEKSIYAKNYKIFLELLREFRKSAKLTQIDLAERLGVTQSFISKCERGERRIDLLEWLKFCKAMETKPGEFFKVLEARLMQNRPHS